MSQKRNPRTIKEGSTMNETRNFAEIPASACTMDAGCFELGDNGKGAKSAPVRLVARSGQPIEHPYWGKVAHDLSGMHMHKSRLALDYVHDSNQIIGYLNHFDIDSGDLVTSGALVPFKDTDRATEILHKMGEGVPYEASINFGGDGIKVQEVAEGELSEVNGYQFEGPGVIIREWPLRGVAVCPYGADMNTESAAAFSQSKQVFSASVVTEPEATTEECAMSESVDVEAKVETPVVESEEVVETVETPVVEELAAAETVEAEPEVEVEAEAEVEEVVAELSREEFAQISTEFGAEIASKIMCEGGDYSTALKLHADALADENKALKAQLSELDSGSRGIPAKAVAAAEPKKPLITLK